MFCFFVLFHFFGFFILYSPSSLSIKKFHMNIDSTNPKTKTHFLTSLLIFNITINRELMRSLHVYRLMKGKESEVEREKEREREFVFSESGPYVEIAVDPLLRLLKFKNPTSEVFEGFVNGLWVCIFAFHGHHNPHHLTSIPSILSLSRQKLAATGAAETKKRRAASKDIARITLSDLAKYFDLPITAASKNLKVGLTVLKRQCRKFGIPHWPHRKIKSLDGLIRDLQKERNSQQQGNKAVAIAVAKRQRMLESEKECIERKPFLEMKSDTKRFRQDVLKRRHRARVLRTQALSISGN